MSTPKTTVMNWLRKNFPGAFKPLPPPIINTPWGPVTESARKQAAVNMKLDENLRARVENMVIGQMGSVEEGMKECRRRYPEVYED